MTECAGVQDNPKQRSLAVPRACGVYMVEQNPFVIGLVALGRQVQ
jgi:hypothetical protein